MKFDCPNIMNITLSISTLLLISKNTMKNHDLQYDFIAIKGSLTFN